MNPTVDPQHQNGYNQFSTANQHIAPPASQYERRSPGNIVAKSQHFGHPGSQATAHTRLGGPELAFEPPSPQRPLHHQPRIGSSQSSAQQPLQHLPFTTSCQYLPSIPEHNLASLQRPPLPQYTSSQKGHPNPLHLNPFTTPTSNDYPVSHETYREEDNTSSFEGFQGRVSSNDLCSHNAGNPSGDPRADLSNQDFHGSLHGPNSASIGRYGQGQTRRDGTGQSIMSQIDTSFSLDPLKSFQDLYRNVVPNEYLRVNAGGEVGNEAKNISTMGNYIDPGIQGSDSLDIGYQDPPSTTHLPGIDPSLENSDVWEKYRQFSTDVDQTGTGGSYMQNDFLPSDTVELLNPIDRPTTPTFSMSDTVSKGRPRGASESTSRSRRSGRRQVSSRSSGLTCKKCDEDPNCENKPEYTGKSQKTSLAKHIRKKHSDSQHYLCLLEKNGSTCNTVITDPQNRRRHLEGGTHRMKLPPKDIAKRNQNAETDEVLDFWFAKIAPTRSL